MIVIPGLINRLYDCWNAGIRAARACRAFLTGIHGTDPVGGGNIVVFILYREHGSRAVIMTDEVVVIIDGP